MFSDHEIIMRPFSKDRFFGKNSLVLTARSHGGELIF